MSLERFWRGRRVLLTGHTGFKGAWTALLLRRLGASVFGYALPPEGETLFEAANVAADIDHTLGDIRDASKLEEAFAKAEPSVVLHMAAQALVRRSYAQPVETYATNVLGTAQVLEAARKTPDIEAVVVITSDKCYENRGWVWGYREMDELGGHDPYSNSKACAELVTSAYRSSFFSTPDTPAVASARAGNVIGGGDWSEDRLIPDAIRAFTSNEPLRIRNPHAIRPWQHVLDPILGYLALAEHLVMHKEKYAAAWNFGPSSGSEVPVEKIVDRVVQLWGPGASWEHGGGDHPHEATYLKLDSARATSQLGWRPQLDLDQALEMTVAWYRDFYDGRDARACTLAQIDALIGNTEGSSNAAV